MTNRRAKEVLMGAVGAIALAACSLASPLSTKPYAPSDASLLPPADDDAAIRYSLLYSFGQNGKPDDGRTPLANLVTLGGALYGTTAYGGATFGPCSIGCGTLFRVSSSGSELVVHRFKSGAADGAVPLGGLLAIGQTFYGTTSAGGGARACSGGCGTVYASSVQGTIRMLHRFRGGRDGAEPASGLIELNGTLYGTTLYGGRPVPCPMGCGTVFRVSPNGKAEKVIYEFKGGSDGAQPAATLSAVGGVLYGTTEYGGGRTPFCATGCGTVFRLRLDGTAETVIHRFAYAPRKTDGAYPSAGLVSISGTLYGTTSGGGNGSGTVFMVRPSSRTERTLHVFLPGTNDGVRPDAGLIAAGALLYGTTRDGGKHSSGTVFEISTAGKERVLYSFKGKPDGARPQASLVSLAGTLFGTTTTGGPTSGGTVFGVRP